MTVENENWMELARIVRPQGRRGEVLAEILTDFPESFSQRKRLYLRAANGGSPGLILPADLEAHWFHKERIVFKFRGIDSIAEAEKLRDHEVLIPLSERMQLTGDAVYVSDLIGMTVIDLGRGAEDRVGTIIEVQPEGIGPAMLVVQSEAQEPALIPFVKAYLRRVDLAAKELAMSLPEGLLSLQKSAAPRRREAKSPLHKERP